MKQLVAILSLVTISSSVFASNLNVRLDSVTAKDGIFATKLGNDICEVVMNKIGLSSAEAAEIIAGISGTVMMIDKTTIETVSSNQMTYTYWIKGDILVRNITCLKNL